MLYIKGKISRITTEKVSIARFFGYGPKWCLLLIHKAQDKQAPVRAITSKVVHAERVNMKTGERVQECRNAVVNPGGGVRSAEMQW